MGIGEIVKRKIAKQSISWLAVSKVDRKNVETSEILELFSRKRNSKRV
jgi:hypothetical protein